MIETRKFEGKMKTYVISWQGTQDNSRLHKITEIQIEIDKKLNAKKQDCKMLEKDKQTKNSNSPDIVDLNL